MVMLWLMKDAIRGRHPLFVTRRFVSITESTTACLQCFVVYSDDKNPSNA